MKNYNQSKKGGEKVGGKIGDAAPCQSHDEDLEDFVWEAIVGRALINTKDKPPVDVRKDGSVDSSQGLEWRDSSREAAERAEVARAGIQANLKDEDRNDSVLSYADERFGAAQKNYQIPKKNSTCSALPKTLKEKENWKCGKEEEDHALQDDGSQKDSSSEDLHICVAEVTCPPTVPLQRQIQENRRQEAGAFAMFPGQAGERLYPGETTPSPLDDTGNTAMASSLGLRGSSSQVVVEMNLVQANPVREENGSRDIESAKLFDPEDSRQRVQKWRRDKRRCLCLLVFLCVACGVVLGSLFGTRSHSTHKPEMNPPPSASPTMAPPPMDRLESLYTELLPSTKENLFNSSTPQRQAWDWLLSHQNIFGLPEWRKKQLFAMVTVFYAMEGPSWPKNIRQDSLNDTIHECEWIYLEGVEAVARQFIKEHLNHLAPCSDAGEVQAMALYILGLAKHKPFIPPEIALLTSLSVVSLPMSGLKVPLSAIMTKELTQLPRLELVALFANSLTGTLPSEIGRMSSLEYLYLFSNKITGPLPSELGLATRLRQANFFGNSLDGTIPTEVGRLSNLTSIRVGENSLTGPLPSQLGLLTKLREIYLERNAFSGPIPSELGLLTKLTELGLMWNQLSGTIPTELASLTTTLRSMWLDHNMLSGTVPEDLCALQTHNTSLNFDYTESLCGCVCLCPFNSINFTGPHC